MIFRQQITWSRLSMTLVTLRRTWKYNPWCVSYFTTPNCKLHVHFHSMKLNCGKAKVDLNLSSRFKSNSKTLGFSLIFYTFVSFALDKMLKELTSRSLRVSSMLQLCNLYYAFACMWLLISVLLDLHHSGVVYFIFFPSGICQLITLFFFIFYFPLMSISSFRSALMDCVGCEKCRLWGKLQVLGLGTALKILFSVNGQNQPHQIVSFWVSIMVSSFYSEQ